MAKVLVVDDDPPVRELVSYHLIREGFQVLVASNGMQTIAIARAELPALILLDIGLPLLDGRQVVRRLRSIPETCSIPIIALTGASFGALDQLIAVAGCDDYVTKPIDCAQLIARVRWLLQSEPAAGQAVFQPDPG